MVFSNEKKRILLKISGEFLRDEKNSLSAENAKAACAKILELAKVHEVGIVVGGGNIFRGKTNGSSVNSESAHKIGIAAGLVNALFIVDAFYSLGFEKIEVFSSIDFAFAQTMNASHAREAMSKGSIVVFAGGTGLPFFSHDTAAVVRGLEVRADLLMKASKVDGVYDKDPKKYKDAVRFDEISGKDFINRNLGIMDISAVDLAAQHDLPIIVFDFPKVEDIAEVIEDKSMGSRILPS
jgi:uridylate kinase